VLIIGRFDSNYKYNPFNPKNWTLLCKINIILSIILILDWIFGYINNFKPISYSFLSETFDKSSLFILIIPLITIIIIMMSSVLLNDDIFGTPIFGVILIKLMLNIGACQFTLFGDISERILQLICSIVIGIVFVFVILFETEDENYFITAMWFGILLITVNFIIFTFLALQVFMLYWSILFISICVISTYLIKKKRYLIGAIIILVFIIINDYIISSGLNGFKIGIELLRLIAILLIIREI